MIGEPSAEEGAGDDEGVGDGERAGDDEGVGDDESVGATATLWWLPLRVTAITISTAAATPAPRSHTQRGNSGRWLPLSRTSTIHPL
jgi:hypothetical protein